MDRTEGIKGVYHITDRKDKEAIWTRIGSAFINRDNSLNVILNELPLDGRLQIRDDRPNKKGERNE